MDTQSISEVNKRFIFYRDNHHETANRDKLFDVYKAARDEFRFYDRMYNELSEMIDTEREKMRSRECPSREQIDAANLFDAIELKLKRQYFIEDTNKISGIYKALSQTHLKREHARKLEMQSKRALEG